MATKRSERSEHAEHSEHSEHSERSITDWVAWVSPGVLIVVGAALFVIPLPPTSTIGIGLVVLGVLMWIAEYLGMRREREHAEMDESTESTEG